MKLVCISDTHNQHNNVPIPPGDVLIHAGDFTSGGSIKEIIDFDSWLASLPHKWKVVIAGNHDLLFEKAPTLARSLVPNAIYLQDQMTEIQGIKIYGTPWQPRFFDWAFNLDRGNEIRRKWDMIPEDIDVLVTHGPPYGILDQTIIGELVGCDDLLARIEIVKPKCHIFGHIHHSYGAMMGEGDNTLHINASSLDERYKYKHPPFVIDTDNWRIQSLI